MTFWGPQFDHVLVWLYYRNHDIRDEVKSTFLIDENIMCHDIPNPFQNWIQPLNIGNAKLKPALKKKITRRKPMRSKHGKKLEFRVLSDLKCASHHFTSYMMYDVHHLTSWWTLMYIIYTMIQWCTLMCINVHHLMHINVH